jgi:hypothetical protein
MRNPWCNVHQSDASLDPTAGLDPVIHPFFRQREP